VRLRIVIAGGFVLCVAALGAGVYGLVRASSGSDLDAEAAAILRGDYKPRHVWRSVRARHWQIVSSDLEDPAVTDAREGTRGACPGGMVEVKGSMRLDPDSNPYSEERIEQMHKRLCTDWIQKEFPERCRSFDRDKWLAMSEGLAQKPMHFCIDRFEYPNLKGQSPIIYVSWYEAVELCEEQGKRLCNEDEWTFACEGEEARPYPYGDGYTRDPSKCITDERWRPYNERAMQPRDAEQAGWEMDRLWRGKASGTQPECRSPFGVYDMTGNVDEWTRSVREGERPSILKGGYWGPVRTRCRPTTRSHDQNHTFYQQGFRCCAEPGAATRAPREPGAEPRAPLPRELE
jgi:hypothetical protein